MNKVEKSDDVVSNDTISNPLEISRHGNSHIGETLEEAAGNYPSIIRTISPQWESEIEMAFKAGAQWQKEHLMENTMEAVIHPYDGEIWVDKDLLSIYNDCQRVKLIIIEEE